MKNSTLLGSAVTVLLAFSMISYSRTYIQKQDPKPVPQTNQSTSQQVSRETTATETTTSANEGTTSAPTNSATAPTVPATKSVEKAVETTLRPSETYMATAYSFRGRTASGRPVGRGVIAADPRVLPLGTRVRIEAGDFTGEYIVADTGGAVKGRRVDIWTPTSREAMRFGRREVKLTVLELGGKHATSSSNRPRQSPTSVAATTDPNKKLEK